LTWYWVVGGGGERVGEVVGGREVGGGRN